MSSRLVGGTAAAVLLAAASLTAVAAPAARAGTGGSRTVDYYGYRLQVPAGWQVVDLAQDPRACVRFDKNTVYLGTPGADEDCPAHLVGRTDAVLVQPVPHPNAFSPAAPVVAPGTAVPAGIVAEGAHAHEIRVRLRGTGLQLTATYGKDPAQVNGILAGATVVAGAAPAPAAAPSPTAKSGTATVAPDTDITGSAFDTCSAPSVTQLNSWMSDPDNPYRGVGFYLGGSTACAGGNVSPSWVSALATSGWSFLPLYVAPSASALPGDPAAARSQGAADAADAIGKAQALGFGAGSVLYNDLEGYDSSLYRTQVLNYLSGWSDEVRGQAFRAGAYVGGDSGVQDLAANYDNTAYSKPDVLWSAAWSTQADTSDAGMMLSAYGSNYWPAGRRVHQYSGNVTETYGGVSVQIDGDAASVNS